MSLLFVESSPGINKRELVSTTDPEANDVETLRNFTQYVAEAAGRLLIEMQPTALLTQTKSHIHDIQTTADTASETFIRNLIAEQYPHDGFLSEEMGLDTRNPNARRVWICDPLDGTIAYMHDGELWGVLLAVEENERTIASCVNLPVFNRVYTAARGLGAMVNGKDCHVSGQDYLESSRITMHRICRRNSSNQISYAKEIYSVLIDAVNSIENIYADAISLCNVTRLTEAHVVIGGPSGPQWWDVAPGILLVQEAGGIVTDFEGNPIINHDLSQGLIASNGRIHEQLLSCIQNVKQKTEY